MSTFTPGEWKVVSPDRANPSLAMVAACDGQVRIYEAPLTDETEANARLIAAAKDLYIACTRLLLARETGLNYDLEVAVELATVALEKADGVEGKKPC